MSEAIPPPDCHHLLAAQGWLELGNDAEASAELARIGPALQIHPAVLEVHWGLLAHAQQWEACVSAATRLIEAEPNQPAGWIHRSYALHELKRTAEARDYLLTVVKRFPQELTILYNLACYECRLNNSSQALAWLTQLLAHESGPTWRATALKDKDLQPLWEILPQL